MKTSIPNSATTAETQILVDGFLVQKDEKASKLLFWLFVSIYRDENKFLESSWIELKNKTSIFPWGWYKKTTFMQENAVLLTRGKKFPPTNNWFLIKLRIRSSFKIPQVQCNWVHSAKCHSIINNSIKWKVYNDLSSCFSYEMKIK